jgi:hypothetical protein
MGCNYSRQLRDKIKESEYTCAVRQLQPEDLLLKTNLRHNPKFFMFQTGFTGLKQGTETII